MISYSICLFLSDLFHFAGVRAELLSVHVVAHGNVHSFLWQSSIPLCICICTHTTHHIFSSHSSGDGPLASFHTFTIVNNAAVNIGVLVYLFSN